VVRHPVEPPFHLGPEPRYTNLVRRLGAVPFFYRRGGMPLAHTGRGRLLFRMSSPTDVRPLVLLVEDDRDTREMYAVALDLSGFRISEAGTAAQARAAAHTSRPDVVVSDLTLPDADGCELCAEFSENPETRHVPTIALTGRSSDEDLERCTAAGCVRVLVKPCTPDTLAAVIGEVLSEAATRRD
jgi:CheY-like chemotaxis protein